MMKFKPYSASILVLGGLLLVAMGIYFVLLRSPLLPDLFELQNIFYADNRFSLLIIFQGVDTCGKDVTIRHVMTCMNPMGVQVKSFKQPTEEELEHDFLWRVYPHFPAKGDEAAADKWDNYIEVYDMIINKCNERPWHIIPADKRWYRNSAVAKVLTNHLESLHLKFS